MNSSGINTNQSSEQIEDYLDHIDLSDETAELEEAQPLFINPGDKPPYNFPTIPDYTLKECEERGWRLLRAYFRDELEPDLILPNLGYSIIYVDGDREVLGVFDKI